MIGRLGVACLWLFISTFQIDAATLGHPHNERGGVMRKAAAAQTAKQEEEAGDDDQPDQPAQVKSELEEDEPDSMANKKHKKEDESSTEKQSEEDADESESSLVESEDDEEAIPENEITKADEKDLKESDNGKSSEIDDIHYVAQKSLAPLKEMHAQGHATKDGILSLISDKFEETLGDNEMMVPVRIQGFTGHFPEALKTMSPAAFLEKLVTGLNVPAEHKPITVAQLASDTEAEARAGDDGDQGEEKDDGGKDSDRGESLLEGEQEGKDEGEEADEGDEGESEESEAEEDSHAEEVTE